MMGPAPCANVYVTVLVLISAVGVHNYKSNTALKKYVVVKERVNYFAALEHCNANNQRLATVHSQKEQQDLKNAILRADDREEWFWIGLTCLSKKETFKWISTGQPLGDNFQTWCDHQPDNWKDNEDCVTVYNQQDYRWNDADCRREFFFVCEEVHYPRDNNVVSDN